MRSICTHLSLAYGTVVKFIIDIKKDKEHTLLVYHLKASMVYGVNLYLSTEKSL